MHQQGAHSQASRAGRPTAPASCTSAATTTGRAVRAHSTGNGPVEFSGTARARPRVPVSTLAALSASSGALRVLELGVPATALIVESPVVVQVLVPVCGPPM